MKTMDFDRIASSAPINRDAAQAFSATGDNWDTKRKFTAPAWDTPPKMRPVPPDAPDLVGLKKGRLTVLGLLDSPRTSSARGSWVVRCTCGTYTVRKAKALSNPVNDDDKCERCTYTQILFKRAANPEYMALAAERDDARAGDVGDV